jgi:tetratricopeptide (TPR) repeat protein
MSVAAISSTGLLALLKSYAFLLVTFAKAFVYPAYLDPYRGYDAPTAAMTALVLAAAALAPAYTFFLVRRQPDNPRIRTLAFGLAFALITFLPASLSGPNLDIVGDRYGYFPLVGMFFAASSLVGHLVHSKRGTAPVAYVLVAICLALFVRRDWSRLADWENERTLFTASLRDNATNAYSLYSLGYLEAIEGNFAEADVLLRRSYEARPSSWRTLNALCYVRIHQDNPRAAEEYCEQSVALQPSNPRAWLNLASARVNRHAWSTGAEAASRAVELKPRSAEARYLRAACFANLGHIDDAKDDLRAALDLEPGHHGARNLLEQFRAKGIP